MIKRVASLVNNLDNNTIFKIKSNLGNKCLGSEGMAKKQFLYKLLTKYPTLLCLTR